MYFFVDANEGNSKVIYAILICILGVVLLITLIAGIGSGIKYIKERKKNKQVQTKNDEDNNPKIITEENDNELKIILPKQMLYVEAQTSNSEKPIVKEKVEVDLEKYVNAAVERIQNSFESAREDKKKSVRVLIGKITADKQNYNKFYFANGKVSWHSIVDRVLEEIKKNEEVSDAEIFIKRINKTNAERYLVVRLKPLKDIAK